VNRLLRLLTDRQRQEMLDADIRLILERALSDTSHRIRPRSLIADIEEAVRASARGWAEERQCDA